MANETEKRAPGITCAILIHSDGWWTSNTTSAGRSISEKVQRQGKMAVVPLDDANTALRTQAAELEQLRTKLAAAESELAAIHAQPIYQIVPLTDKQLLDAYCATPNIFQYVQAFKAGAQFAEQYHAILAQPGLAESLITKPAKEQSNV